MVPETSVTFNQLTRLIARKDFISFIRRESLDLFSNDSHLDFWNKLLIFKGKTNHMGY
jgi:hypothetical protein